MSKQTVIGVFATKDKAQAAVNALKSEGYNSAAIDFMSNDAYRDESVRATADEREKGFFSSLFGSDDEFDKDLHMASRRGNTVTVHTQDMSRAEKAADILDQYGAINANEASTKLRERGATYGGTNTEHTLDAVATDLSYHDASATAAATATTGEQTVDIVKEDIAVGKQEVNTGGMRLRSRVISRPVEETVRLREEHVFINRKPVDKVVDANTLDAFQEKTVELTETAERAVVQKTARVVEQVSIGKEATETTETIKETLRETDVEVERIAGTGDVTDAKGKVS